MSLDFDVSALRDQSVTSRWDEKGVEHWSEETQCIVFATMSVGINHITEENWIKFYERYVAINMSLGYEPQSNYITLEMVRQHIGLKTNASPYTDAEIKRRITRFTLETARKEAQRQFNQEIVDMVTEANPWDK